MLTSPETLDDVDFTVLAATSVLDDLIEKCPPAEACRDAFQRMSKATIKMCLQTTGFGDQVGLHSNQNKSQLSQPMQYGVASKGPPSAAEPMHIPLDPSLTSGYAQTKAALSQDKRPAPHFDLDLRDLFSDEESASRPFGRLNLLPRQPFPSASQPQPQPPGSSSSYPSMTVKREPSNANFTSPPLPNSGLPHSTTASPNLAFASTQQQNPNSNQNPYTLSNTAPYTSLAATIQNQYPMMSPFSDLDFLETLPIGGPDGSSSGPAGSSNAAMANGQGVANGMLGGDWDLGLGMGWDGSLPTGSWGDTGDGVGGSMDLFEGFFFGNAGTNL
jgi:hypothetical protein